MTRPPTKPEEQQPYQNDYRLIQAYQEATSLDDEGLAALCPSYIKLSETSKRYQDEELLGKGGVKDVYRIFDNHTRRWVAMAQLREDRGPEFYDLFVNEAWLTSSLNHPNIISVHDVGIGSSGHPFFTMDLKGNTTLATFINSDKRDQRALLRDFMKICDAISYAHSLEIIHLDLKPENIQTDAYGEVLVCDWGLGKIISDIEEDAPLTPSVDILDNMTLIGEIKGSPGYMTPEQIAGNSTKDQRTDIFSLGCILHAILTGEPPFRGNHQERLEATSQGIVTNPCEKFPPLKIPPSLGAVSLKALTKSPDDRYQSVSDLKEDVQRFMEGFSTNAEDSNFLRETSLFVSRNRTPVFIGFLSLILLSVLSTLFIQKLDFLQQSVDKESQLADQYASEAEFANTLHLETLSKSKEQQLALSQSLVSSVRNLKNKGIYDTPMKSVREAVVLSDHALALDPDSEAAKYQLFALYLIQLNFQKALEFPLPGNHPRYGYMSFAKAYSEFNYHRLERPPLKTLREFLEKARDLAPHHSPVIERMISYDSAVRPSKKLYSPIILSLLKYLNPKTEGIELKRGSRQSELILRTPKEISLIADPADSGRCVLRYLKSRSLAIECPDRIELNQLNGLRIQDLDLTKCENFVLDAPLTLPSLETITIDPTKHSPEILRKWIRGIQEFEIILAPR